MATSPTIQNSTTGQTIDPVTGLPTTAAVQGATNPDPNATGGVGAAGSSTSTSHSSSSNQVIDPATGLPNTAATPLTNQAPVAPVSTGPSSGADVGSNLTGLLSQSSPYLQAAQTGAAQTAQSRGLLNSSIAAGAGEQAAINSALPIASQQASTAAQANLQAQNLTANQNTQTAATNAAQANTVLQGQINTNMQNTQILANALTSGAANATQLNIADLQAAVSFNSQLAGLTQSQITANTAAGDQLMTGITANQGNTSMNQGARDTANASLLATYQAQVAAGDAYAKAAAAITTAKASSISATGAP